MKIQKKHLSVSICSAFSVHLGF